MRKECNLLHKTKLEDFKAWLVEQGHEILPIPGGSDYERLRWQGKPGKPMPIIYERIASREHLTCNGEAVAYVQRWLRSR